MSGISPNQLQGMRYPNSMMPGGSQDFRRAASQPGLNQANLDQTVIMHPNHPGMGGMAMNPQGIPPSEYEDAA